MPTPSKRDPAVRVPAEAHSTLRRIALDLGPSVGRVLTLGEVIAAMVTITDRDREPLRAVLAGDSTT